MPDDPRLYPLQAGRGGVPAALMSPVSSASGSADMSTSTHRIAQLRQDTMTNSDPAAERTQSARHGRCVRRCLQAILNEEWEHRLYAERDFDVLESRSP